LKNRIRACGETGRRAGRTGVLSGETSPLTKDFGGSSPPGPTSDNREVMELQLTQGKVAYVDDVDADLAAFKRYAHKREKTFYAVRNIPRPDGGQTSEYLHQEIARRMGIVGPPDHIDRNGLNCRRSNLRAADSSQQQAHRGCQKNNSSGFKGVSWFKALGKWQARIQVNRKQRHLGFFDDKIEAAKVRDRAALEAFGEFAVLNFPTRSL
jgi:hypothetical protein